VLPHEMNRNRKPIFKTVETGHFDFVETGDSQEHRRASPPDKRRLDDGEP
jgi:hypothetical protein